jgi:hypothetical protein
MRDGSSHLAFPQHVWNPNHVNDIARFDGLILSFLVILNEQIVQCVMWFGRFVKILMHQSKW